MEAGFTCFGFYRDRGPLKVAFAPQQQLVIKGLVFAFC